MEKKKLLYIASPSYSGSTLLTLLLAKNANVATIGELKASAFGDVTTYRCSCGELMLDCPFFTKIESDVRKLGASFSLRNWTTHFTSPDPIVKKLLMSSLRGKLFERVRTLAISTYPPARRALSSIIETNVALINAICVTQGSDIFLDGSKDANRIKFMYDSGHWDVKVLFLFRDGRGTTNSYMKHENVSMEVAAKAWRDQIQELHRLHDYVPQAQILHIAYEQLCEDPNTTLEQICDFCNVELNLSAGDESAQHIFGNNMRTTELREIRRDTSWQSQLAETDLKLFEDYCGAVNRSLING